MGKLIDLTGKRFGRLIVVSQIDERRNKKIYWNCICDCGNSHNVGGGGLFSGYVTSCGCLKSEVVANRNRTHNLSRTPEYKCYHRMMTRCYNTKIERYKNYGGRGIVVSDEWLNSFETFLSDMGNKPSKNHSLDRIDVNGNYCKENCRWATVLEQSNNKRNNRFIEYNGCTKTLAEWCRQYGLSNGVIYNRLNKGWSLEDTLTKPLGTRKRI